ncbi:MULTISPECIES: winged helix-turn-helix transcriptional regulator [Streptomyces]|jgi:DNA-binding HxlR family transcriptional regulator|uniref:Winged helix-turn-helix transcriptional regulator n=1 Tax=Streptomyces eurythermus TaxID=42237 RepID=A0ABW6Z9Q3_9ACTN|nr:MULTISPECIES: helix-turn-helix domain-containing protein [Streptomyces]QIS74831.1 helix-turn-helix transcriptional regulator [Streptomyces sp. DSM 40868]WDM10862.1 helix-turn-helix transcriptional regulator [Streptomyces lavenduligriseus]
MDENHDSAACKRVDDGITRVFQLLGKRWSGPIVAVLVGQPAYFTDLRRAVPGISERMLSDRLAELGAAGLVLREVDEGPPLRVSYRLTEAGAALEPALRELAQWAKDHLPDVSECTGAALDRPRRASA